MIQRFQRPSVRALGLLAALLWAFNVGAGEVHLLLVAHSVCAEHHEVVESPLRDTASHDSKDRRNPSAWAATAHGDHGCHVDLLVPSSPPPAFALHREPLVAVAKTHVLALAQAPRGPPLDYAPKTSPPTAG